MNYKNLLIEKLIDMTADQVTDHFDIDIWSDANFQIHNMDEEQCKEILDEYNNNHKIGKMILKEKLKHKLICPNCGHKLKRYQKDYTCPNCIKTFNKLNLT